METRLMTNPVTLATSRRLCTHRGGLPQPLEGILQCGKQIGAGLDPVTGNPETARKKWTSEEKMAI